MNTTTCAGGFDQSVCELQTTSLQTNCFTVANIKIKEILF